MEDALILRSSDEVASLVVQKEAEAAQGYADHARAANTLLAYKADWVDFVRYCKGRSLSFLPAAPETVAIYLGWLADNGKKPATIARRLSSISVNHTANRLDSPAGLWHFAVKQVWDGIKRKHGTAQVRKTPAVTENLKKLVERVPQTLTGSRDRAMLLLGFAAALRRSELVALSVEDVEFVNEGIRLTIRRSKVDQEGQGRVIGIRAASESGCCPVRALKEWLFESGITTGHLFRPITRYQTLRNRKLTGQVVAQMIKRYAKLAELKGDYSGHSLRAGLITSAAKNRASERDIMRQSGHVSVTTLRKYIREADVFQDNISGLVGL